MSMNDTIAGLYGTNGATASDNDMQKVASAELFAKLAADSGIDLKTLNDEQITTLWDQTFGKTAMKHEGESDEDYEARMAKEKEAPPKKEEKKDEEKEAAAHQEAAVQEFYQTKLAHDQLAFMDYCGRVMAHSYVNELTKIGQKVEGGDLAKTGAAAATAGAPDDVTERIQKLAAAAPGQQPAAEGVSGTPNFDFFAAQSAVELAKTAGVDEAEVVRKLNATLELGVPGSVKLASAQDPDEGLHIRALELLEHAGYEVNWNS